MSKGKTDKSSQPSREATEPRTLEASEITVAMALITIEASILGFVFAFSVSKIPNLIGIPKWVAVIAVALVVISIVFGIWRGAGAVAQNSISYGPGNAFDHLAKSTLSAIICAAIAAGAIIFYGPEMTAEKRITVLETEIETLKRDADKLSDRLRDIEKMHAETNERE